MKLIFFYLFPKVDISLLLKQSNCYISVAVITMPPCTCLSGYKTNQESEQDTERQENIVMIGIGHVQFKQWWRKSSV